MATSIERPLRRDAERNRQRILIAAREVFRERGLEVSMDEIARHAGVGVGTVYRRFPDKEQLINALFEDQLEQIVSLAEDCLSIDDPWDAFTAFMTESVERQQADRGLKELLLSTAHGARKSARARERLVPIITGMVERAKATGDLRPDVEATDYPLLQFALGAVMDYANEVDPEVWRRMLGILIDGLRTRRDEPTPLPVAALDLDQVDQAMRSWRPRSRPR